MVKPAVLRPVFLVRVAQVPFAHHRRLITRFFQGLRECALVSRQSVGVARKYHEGLQPIAHGVAASHQLSARRRTNRHSVNDSSRTPSLASLSMFGVRMSLPL